MRETNVAIVGCGYVAHGHIQAWRKIDSARVIAVVDLNEALAKSTAEFWKIGHHLRSLQELVHLGGIDVVDICTPPHSHSALAVQAMEAGFNVLIEKPMAMTVKDATEIVEARRRTNVEAGVIHNWLFEPPMLRADELVRKDVLGEILSLDVAAISTNHDSMAANKDHWCHRFPGGRFSEMLAHPIYLTRHFLGKIEEVDVSVAKMGSYPWMISDELCATFSTSNKVGRAYASFNAPRTSIFVNLYGKKAVLSLELINATVNLLSARTESRFGKASDSLRQARQLTGSTIRSAARIAFGKWLSGHDTYIKLFVEGLNDGRKPPATVEEGLEVVRTLEVMCGKITETESARTQSR
jgi:predicted dehydrogenase